MTYAWSDFSGAFLKFRSWAFLAFKQIQIEHRRTFFGSLWIVMAYAIPSTGIACLMAQVQGRTLQEHVPYVLFGFIGWGFISGAIVFGCDVFYRARSYLLQMPLPRSVFVLSLMLRQLYLMAIHIVTAMLISLAFGWRPTPTIAWILPAICIYCVAGFSVATFMGLIAARFRDISALTGASMRLIMFFTPVIWHPDSSRGTADGLIGLLVHWNPFSHFVYIFRDGLLGMAPTALNWIVSGSITLCLAVIGVVSLQLMGRRLPYWL